MINHNSLVEVGNNYNKARKTELESSINEIATALYLMDEMMKLNIHIGHEYMESVSSIYGRLHIMKRETVGELTKLLENAPELQDKEIPTLNTGVKQFTPASELPARDVFGDAVSGKLHPKVEAILGRERRIQELIEKEKAETITSDESAQLAELLRRNESEE